MATSCIASFSSQHKKSTSQDIMEEMLHTKFPVLKPQNDYIIEGTTPNHEEQFYCVKYRQNKTLTQVSSWYLISSKWFNKWENYVGYETWLSFNAGKKEFYPGPVDNGPLIDCYRELRRGISEPRDFKLVTEEVWAYLLAIYGFTNNTFAIPRKVVSAGCQVKRHFVEVRPIDIGCQLIASKGTQFGLIRASRSDTMEQLKEYIYEQFDISKDEELILKKRRGDSFYKLDPNSTKTLQQAGIGEDQQIFVELQSEECIPKKEFSPDLKKLKSKEKSSVAVKKLSGPFGLQNMFNKHLKIRKSQSQGALSGHQF